MKTIQKYVFLKMDESGVKVTLSKDLDEFTSFNHYGFVVDKESYDELKESGIACWVGNDTWYYIMQHDAWEYMDLDLKIETGRTTL